MTAQMSQFSARNAQANRLRQRKCALVRWFGPGGVRSTNRVPDVRAEINYFWV